LDVAYAPREWTAMLDVAADRQPFPFREFVVKIHSRCDLACDYCYVYEMADRSWRDQPKRMSEATARQVAFRIGEHVRTHELREIGLVLHGGEPLLAGPDFIARLVDMIRHAAGDGAGVHPRVQTNGVRLNEEFLAVFRRLGIEVGVSLDGAATAHDRHRRFRDGRGSHAAVAGALALLTSPRYRDLFGGLLCVIDLRNDPLRSYQALLGYGPPKVDFLLPHGTWDAPPPGRVADPALTPYADWLIAIFDDWYARPRTRVRLFEEIIRALLGGTPSAESVGTAPVNVVVVEANGAIEQVDTLKAAFHGASRTGLDIQRDSFDAALRLPEIAARQSGVRGLCARCQECHLSRVCGGGLYAHRYRAATGFANPSVYCPDLMRLIDHVRETVQADVIGRLAQALGKQGAAR
jgi:uncharacterized protein